MGNEIFLVCFLVMEECVCLYFCVHMLILCQILVMRWQDICFLNGNQG